MLRPFFEKKAEYFWEYEYPFGETFLKGIFGDGYKRKYSMIGDGIYNLVYIDNKIYELTFKSTKSFLPNDDKKALRDATKDKVVDSICNDLSNRGVKYTRNGGKFITFEIGSFIAKVEIIKKMKEPQ